MYRKNTMKKIIIVISLILIGIASIPVAWLLFPWAQSISATELSDGLKVLISPEEGTWIINTGVVLASVSFLAAIVTGVFYKAPEANVNK